MNNLIKHMGLYFIGLTWLLISCAAEVDRSDESASDFTDSSFLIEEFSNLEVDNLSDNNIVAFEQRAMQKLEDFSDFLAILSDTTIDSEFKKQAALMAVEIFINTENTISFSLSDDLSADEQTIEAFLLELQNGKLGILSIEIQNVSTFQKMKQSNNQEYKGLMKLELSIANKRETQIKKNTVQLECEVMAKKVDKEFGNTSKMVWEVFLGDIYQK